MKYNYKIYNKETKEVYEEGITSGRGSRTEQTRDLQDVRVTLINKLGIEHFSKEADNIKITMKRAEGEIDDGRNMFPMAPKNRRQR